MSENDSNELLRRILRELPVRDPAEVLSQERVLSRMNDIHVLHDHLIRSREHSEHAVGSHPGKERDLPGKGSSFPGMEERVTELLGISRNLCELLEEFENTSRSADFDRVARTLGAGSDLVSIFEEFYTGEDPLKEVLLNGIPFLLSRLEETAYIKSAEVGFKALFQMHTLNIYEKFWKIAKERPMAGLGHSYEDSVELGRTMETLRETLSNRGLARHTRFMLHVLLYIALFNNEVLNMEGLLERNG